MTQNDVRKNQRIASYFIVGMVMWEFFSYFGMQALLILYLTQQLHFPDAKAYAIYGSFTSLIFIMPIVGGWLADRYCGYRYAAMWGCILIIVGHLFLGMMNSHGLYYGLTFLILGIGFFKSNAICLIGDCYPSDSAGRSAAFTWYYVSGNLGAVASQLICPYLAQEIGWHAGFIAAAVGMGFGLLMLIASRKYFGWYKNNIPDTKWQRINGLSKTFLSLFLIAVSFAVVFLVMKHLWVGNLLIVVSLIAALMFLSIYKQATAKNRKSLITIAILTVFATGFWIFDQQGSSSISLFIARYVNRAIGGFTIPTGTFQAINPGIILITGVVIAWMWRWLDKKGVKPIPMTKLSIAMLLLVLGFAFISVGAKIAEAHGLVSMMYPVLGLMLVGSAEMFVDPVLLATITEAAPPHSEGRLVALYYLMVGAIANYLAAKVADLTIDPTQGNATALTYHQAYMQILYVSLAMFLVLFVWGKIKRKLGARI